MTEYVSSMTNPNAWAKAGIMYRENNSPDSKEVALVVSPGGNFSLQWRDTTGGQTNYTILGTYYIPMFIKLTRVGDTFTAYRSDDGINWGIALGSTTVAMNSSIKAGMCVTSHDSAYTSTARFVNITLNNGSADSQAPSVPTGLTATAVSGSQVNLSWTASSDSTGVVGYKVYRGGTQIATVTTGTTYINTGLSTSTQYTYTVSSFDAAGNNSVQSTSASATTLVSLEGPYITMNLPCKVEAENYNVGGEGIAYHDGDAANLGQQYRPSEGVDLQNCYEDAGYDIGWVSANEWMDYTVNVATAGTYDVAFRVASWSDGKSLKLQDNGVDKCTVNLPNTGGNQTWQNVSASVSLSAGIHVIRIYCITDGFNLNYMNFTFTDSQAPTVPTGLTATAVSNNQINLSWTASTDNVGVAGYKIFRDGNHISTTTNTTFSSIGLNPSTQYSYTVSAFDAAGNNTAQCASANATTQGGTDTTAPTVPTGLAATAVSTSQINLSWTASSDNVGVTGYKIYRGGTQIATTSGTTFSNTGLSASTLYSYTVAAYDAAGNNSAQSTAASATTQADLTNIASQGTIIATVTNPIGGGNHNIEIIRDGIKPEVGSSNSNQQYDTYAANGTVHDEYVGYTFGQSKTFNRMVFQEGINFVDGGWFANGTLKVQVLQGGTWTDVASTVSPLYPNANSQGTFGQNYETYSITFNSVTGDGIRLYGRAGGSANFISTGELEVYTGTSSDIQVPTVPTGLAATAVSSSQINLSWTASTDNVGVTGYKIFRNGTQLATATGTTYSNTGLTASTLYTYTVSAYDAAGNNSAQSTPASATTQAPQSIPTPWLFNDIGSPTPAGSASYNSGEFTIAGGGSDIWNTLTNLHM